MKRTWIFLAVGIGLFMGTTAVSNLKSVRFEPKTERDARFRNVLEQQAILKAGRKLIKAGDFEGALEKFNEAIDPKYIKSDRDKFEAISSKVDVYVLQGKFREALKEHDWIFARTPDHQYSIAKHKEILALLDWEKTKNNQIIYDYILWLKEHFREQIPPAAYKGYHTTVISSIFRLYDTIGNHDAGIAYVDEMLAFLKKKKVDRNENAEIYDRIKTAVQATQCMEVGPKDNLDWHACKLIREYLLVREGFEQDKAEGFKGCAGKKPGEECVGHAMRALIKSDYFPW